MKHCKLCGNNVRKRGRDVCGDCAGYEQRTPGYISRATARKDGICIRCLKAKSEPVVYPSGVKNLNTCKTCRKHTRIKAELRRERLCQTAK